MISQLKTWETKILLFDHGASARVLMKVKNRS